MAETIAGDILLGSSPIDASVDRAATDAIAPYIAWTLPPGFNQKRFSIRISNEEPGGFAFTTSGPRTSSETGFQFPLATPLNNSFAGLCKIEVALSESTDGSFEAVLPFRWFVFDRNIESLFIANQLQATWTRGINPDGLPNDPATYQLQIATDALFEDVAYNLTGIVDNPAVVQTLDIPTEEFDPDEGQAYVFRIRQYDGMDWSDWSIANAFVNHLSLPPSVVIDSVTPIDNLDGDIHIDVTVSDIDSSHTTIELTFESPVHDRTPLSLLDSSVMVSPGVRRFTWRSRRQLSASLHEGILLRAIARDEGAYGQPDHHGPFSVDNRETSTPTTGFGDIDTVFPVNAGRTAVLAEPESTKDQEPVACLLRTAKRDAGALSDQLPVHLEPSVFAGHYVLGPVEERTVAGVAQFGKAALVFGFGHGGGEDPDDNPVPPLKFHGAMHVGLSGGFKVFEDYEQTWGYPGDWPATARRLDNPHASMEEFLFASPVGYAPFSDGHPRPFITRQMTGTSFLYGWADFDGVVHPYPDGYDWNSRPAWHQGREVWRYDDAWVQVAREEITGWEFCPTCGGHAWVVAGNAPPYRREPCPNPSCYRGFDLESPLINEETLKPIVVPVLRAVWYRFSHIFNAQPYDIIARTGKPVLMPDSVLSWLHIVGHGLTDKDARRETVMQQDPFYSGPPPAPLIPVTQITGYYIDTPGGRRTLPKGTKAEWQAGSFGGNVVIPHWGAVGHNIPNAGHLIRQQEDSAVIHSVMPRDSSPDQDVTRDRLPAQGRIETTSNLEPGTPLPVDGFVGPQKLDFFMGMDPDGHPGMALRPRPTQVEGIAVRGGMTRVRLLKPMMFRFLQPWWDAYNTIHWQATGSSTSKFHIQWSKLNQGVTTAWHDAIGDNTRLDEETGLRLVDPLTFHMFWQTLNRQMFAAGESYRLRLRMYDTAGRSFSPWVYSSTFQIIDNIPNPVSIIDTIYKPWSKEVEITFRVDDSEGDLYNLKRFWYSDDDGFTWYEINRDHIAGPVTGLASRAGGTQNVSTVTWMAASYNLKPSDDFRVRIESTPTDLEGDLQIPVFKWFSSPNPVGGLSEYTINQILGYTIHQDWDDATGQLVSLDSPQYRPGELELNAIEQEQILSNPTEVAPSGYYSFVDASGVIEDTAGYNTWLSHRYTSHETHNTALSRVGRREAELLRMLHKAQKNLQSSEIYCRKNLIDQGWYAEEHFQGDDPIEETITIRTLSQYTGDEGDEEDTAAVFVDVPRFWRFKVMDRAEGPAGIYNDQGEYEPLDVTDYERVYYKLQIDRHETFDSQSDRPLRNIIRDHLGRRLEVADVASQAPIESSSPVIDDGQAAAGPWDTEASAENPESQFQTNGSQVAASPVVVGSSYKLPPSLLPGAVSGDQMATGETSWEQPYQWRVAAYNPFYGPPASSPRPLITNLTILSDLDAATVNYQMQAHQSLTHASLAHTTQSDGVVKITGYQVSRELLDEPVWVNDQSVNFVSDRRAGPDSQTYRMNIIPWIPVGRDRPQPHMIFDDSLMQYILMTSKKDYNGRWRPVSSRGMTLPKMCEYGLYFLDRGEHAIYSPCLVSHDGGYSLYVTVQATASSLPRIMRATSSDADAWGNLVTLFGIDVGAHPSVIKHNGSWFMWYEKPDPSDGVVKIYMATSEDGLTFTPVDDPVVEMLTDVGSPSVIRWGGAWVMYFNHAGTIASMWSSDGLVWQDYRAELTDATIPIDGQDTLTQALNGSPFIDRYRGNEELFIVYNRKAAGGDHRVHVARLETRAWLSGDQGSIYGLAGHLIDVPSTESGINRQLSFELSSNGLVASDPVKLRLHFDRWDPEEIEFHRQSEWVSIGNAEDVAASMEPSVWRFHEGLRAIPYMEL